MVALPALPSPVPTGHRVAMAFPALARAEGISPWIRADRL